MQAFSASLRAAHTTNSQNVNRLNQPATRPMQNNTVLEYYLLKLDWGQLADPNVDTQQMQEVVGIRMHKYGISCQDSNTLKRASAIVQAQSGKRFSSDERQHFAHETKELVKRLDTSS